jgi:hypothetical protein
MVLKHEHLHNFDEHQELMKKEFNLVSFKIDKSFRGMSSDKSRNNTFGSDSSKIPSLTSMGESSNKINSGSPDKKRNEKKFKLITVLENYVCECKPQTP